MTYKSTINISDNFYSQVIHKCKSALPKNCITAAILTGSLAKNDPCIIRYNSHLYFLSDIDILVLTSESPDKVKFMFFDSLSQFIKKTTQMYPLFHIDLKIIQSMSCIEKTLYLSDLKLHGVNLYGDDFNKSFHKNDDNLSVDEKIKIIIKRLWFNIAAFEQLSSNHGELKDTYIVSSNYIIYRNILELPNIISPHICLSCKTYDQKLKKLVSSSSSIILTIGDMAILNRAIKYRYNQLSPDSPSSLQNLFLITWENIASQLFPKFKNSVPQNYYYEYYNLYRSLVEYNKILTKSLNHHDRLFRVFKNRTFKQNINYTRNHYLELLSPVDPFYKKDET